MKKIILIIPRKETGDSRLRRKVYPLLEKYKKLGGEWEEIAVDEGVYCDYSPSKDNNIYYCPSFHLGGNGVFMPPEFFVVKEDVVVGNLPELEKIVSQVTNKNSDLWYFDQQLGLTVVGAVGRSQVPAKEMQKTVEVDYSRRNKDIRETAPISLIEGNYRLSLKSKPVFDIMKKGHTIVVVKARSSDRLPRSACWAVEEILRNSNNVKKIGEKSNFFGVYLFKSTPEKIIWQGRYQRFFWK